MRSLIFSLALVFFSVQGLAAITDLTFDDASSITPWAGVADASTPEASIAWDASGAIQFSGTNATGGVGRAFIFQYIDGAVDYQGASTVELSFDIKLASPLVGAAIHLQTEFPGAGTINTFDIQNSGINESTWTTLTYTFNNITAGNLFRIHFNLAAGAFVGAGGSILVDNIQINSATAVVSGCTNSSAVNYNPGATVDNGTCQYNIVFQVDMNNVTDAFTTPELNGTFNGWCGSCATMSDVNMDGIWDVALVLTQGSYEYKFSADNWAIQEVLTQGDPCTVGASPFVNRPLTVTGNATLPAVCWASCSACSGGTGGGLPTLTFDDAASITPWITAGDATLPEASMTWNPTGVATGALQISGSNTSAGIGRAYIFQYTDNSVDYAGATNVEVSFDIKLGAPLNGASVHLQTELPGVGTVNNFDIQNQGLNESTWTHLTYSYSGVSAGSIFRIHFNIAAGAFVGAGGTILVDNIQVTEAAPTVLGCMDNAAVNYDPSATEDNGSCQYNITFQVDMNNVTDGFTTPEVNGTFNSWCGNCASMSDANTDGIWDVTITLTEGNYEFKFSADNWNIQEALTQGSSCTVGVEPTVNRSLSVTGNATLPAVCWNSCTVCNTNSGEGLVNLTFDDAASLTPWQQVADATLPEASMIWNPTGVATGALQASGTNTSSAIGRAYIFQYLDPSLDYAGSSSVQLSFDIKLSQPLNGAAIHLQTEMPGVGTVNHFDIQNQGVNESTWTHLTYDFSNIGSGTIFRMNFNLSAGAFVGAGGGILVDNILLTSTGTEVPGCTDPTAVNYDAGAQIDNGSCIYTVTFQVNMNGVTSAFTTPEVNGSFNGWCGGCLAMTDANNDGIWEASTTLTQGYYEFKYAADGWAIEENLTPGSPCTFTSGPFTNRTLTVDGNITFDANCWGTCDVATMALYEDNDGDGYGTGTSRMFCSMPTTGYSINNTDCDDNNAAIHPNASEVCGNATDDDCDGFVNEGCVVSAVANDDFTNATSVSSPNFPYCSNKTVNLTNATSSPEASTAAPVGAGQDVWYAFVASTNGARITSTSVACDVVIELHDAAHNIYGVENETTTGSEILIANNLTPGATYYVLVRNFNPSSVGTVTTCIQNLAHSGPNNGTTFNTLCSYIKCAWNGAQLYSVTFDDGVNQYTASSSATQIPFASLPGLQYGQTYQVTFTTTFIQNDAGGNPTTSEVVSSPYTITIANHAPVALRSTDRCPTTRSIGSFVGADTYVCGIVGYQWEFTLADEFGNPISLDPVIVNVNSASRYVRTSSITGVQPGDHYNVRVRPVFSSGPGTFGSTQMLCIAGSAGIATEGDNATPSLTSVNAERSVKLYPNPNNGEMMNIQLTGITSETVQVNVIDALGRVIVSNQYSVNNTFNGTILFDTKLSSGMYNVQIIDGENTMVERVMVK